MKYVIVYMMISFLFISCTDKNKEKEICNEVPQEITKTKKIAVGDILSGYTVRLGTKEKYNFGEGTKGLALIYFYKSMTIKDKLISFQNKNISDKKLWKELEKRHGQIDMSNDIKIADSYGFFNDKSRLIDSGYLIITRDGVIEKIYSKVCPDSITNLLNKITE